MQEKEKNIILEFGSDHYKYNIMIRFNPVSIWVDLRGLPPSAFLAACLDGTDIINAEEEPEISYVNIDWFINDWDGNKEIIRLIKKRKQEIIELLPDLTKKYGIEYKNNVKRKFKKVKAL